MAGVLQGQEYLQTRAVFGPVSTIAFPTVTLAANVTTPASQAQAPIPCNVKIIAVAANAFDGGNSSTGLGINISSGPSIGTTGTGTLTFTTTATHAGTCTVTIAGPTSGTSRITTFAIGATNTVSQSAAACATALNALGDGNTPQVLATSSAGVVTLYQLRSQSWLTNIAGGAQTYQAVLGGGVTGQTVSPTTATAFSAGTSAQGTPDNFLTSTPSSVFAGPGQLLFSRYHIVHAGGTGGNNDVYYPGLSVGTGVVVPEYDIIFPVTRTLSLNVIYTGEAASTTLQVTALVVPVILDPNQPYPAAGQWVPNNTNLGCPSTA